MRSFNPLMLIPGMLFWVLIAVGAITGNQAIIGIAVVVAVVFVAIVVTGKVSSSNAARAERSRVWGEGVPTTARVIHIGTNGGSLNDHPQIDFELDVAAVGGPAYRVKTRALVSQLAIPRIQPGCEIAVRTDPRDRNVVIIDEALTPYGYK